MNQSKKVTEGSLLTAIFLILLMITILVPGLSFMTFFLLPVPFTLYAYKFGWQPSLIMSGVTIVLSTFFAIAVSLPLALLAGTGGIVLGLSIRQRLTPYETWARGTAGFIGGLILVFIFIQVILQINLIHEIEHMLNDSFEASKVMMKDIGLLEVSEQDWKALENQLASAKNLIPVGITIVSALFAFIAQWISYKVLNRIDGKKYFFPPFRNLQLSMAIIWVYLFAMVFMFMDLDTNRMAYLIAHNVFSLAGMFMVLQGLSYLFFITHRKGWPKALPIIALILTIILPLLFLQFVRILGIIDIGFRLRDRHLKDKK